MAQLVMQLWILFLLLSVPGQCLQHRPEHSGMAHGSQSSESSPQNQAQLEAEKQFSEFNHHFAGLFILLVGLLALLEPYLAARFHFMHYFWCALFWIPGVYLLILSDPESWPVGDQSLHYVLTQNMQVLQHKVFSLLLLGLGLVEYLRVRKKLRAKWTIALFPAIAAAGAMLLLLHPSAAHAGGMAAAAHLDMQKIEHQHIGFAVVGFGIALTKAIADTDRFQARLMRILFA
ncbi:MAG: hypothetical protein HY645_15045 [Acidobacteria bacterium]|nr:hypothetical protein [Acidobacteriota bacterium]